MKKINDRINAIQSQLSSYGTRKMDKRYVWKGNKTERQIELEEELENLKRVKRWANLIGEEEAKVKFPQYFK